MEAGIQPRPLRRASGEVLWPRRLNGVATRLLGALSLLALARYAADFGLSSAAVKVFQYYDELLRVMLGWLDPYLRPWIVAQFARLHLQIEFNEYWRHAYVLLQMLFVRDAGVAFANGRRGLGAVRLIVGIAVAGLFSVLTAVRVPSASPLVDNLVFATLPTVAIYVYDIMMYGHSALFRLGQLNDLDGAPRRTRTQFFGAAVRRANTRLVLCLLVSYACFLHPLAWHAKPPAAGLVAVGVATLANAGYWLWRGGRSAIVEARLGHDWTTSFKESEAGQFGIAITGVLLWTAIFAGVNAGMRQLGL